MGRAGCSPRLDGSGIVRALAEPFARVDIQGAAWFIGGSNVAAVTADAITLRTENGSTLRLYRRGLI